jgi:hypothetical protein
MNASESVNPQAEAQNEEAARFFGLEIVEDDQEPQDAAQDSFEVWPEHWQAMRLFQACQEQLEVIVGRHGVFHRAARSVNVQQELRWLMVPKADQVTTVALYREIEREALSLLNQTQN